MQIGQTVGQYEITAFLGEGAMGKVFRGRDTQLNRDVAIKVLRPEISSRPDLVERFRNEAMTLASLHHSNICSVYAFIEHEGQHAMVLQHLDGQPLEDMLREKGRLGWDEVKRIMKDVLSGLQEAHVAGIVHRDLKPANLMVTPAQKLVIMDFGIARVKNQQRATREGMMVGTLEYASPEQIRGEDVDARSDLYSLGIICFEMLSGKLPFDAKTDYEWVKAQTTETPDFSVLYDHVGRSVVQFLRKTLDKAPDKRFVSAAAMLAALEDIKDATRLSRPGIASVVQDTAATLSAATRQSGGLVAFVKNNLVLFSASALVLTGLGFVALTHLQRPTQSMVSSEPASTFPAGSTSIDEAPPVERTAAPSESPGAGQGALPPIGTQDSTGESAALQALKETSSAPSSARPERDERNTAAEPPPGRQNSPPAPPPTPAEKPAKPTGGYNFRFDN